MVFMIYLQKNVEKNMLYNSIIGIIQTFKLGYAILLIIVILCNNKNNIYGLWAICINDI